MNIGDLFDSPWKVLIVAVVVLVLFGSRKLPDAARSLGRSMRILKSEVSKIHDDDDTPEAAGQGTASGQALDRALAAPAHQQQIEQLQQQVRDLQQQAAGNGAAAADAQRTQQPG
jgi:sec-independent protein translocase protein TatA